MLTYDSIPEFTVDSQHANPTKDKKQYSVIERIYVISISERRGRGRWMTKQSIVVIISLKTHLTE